MDTTLTKKTQEVLVRLGIQEINNGASTGAEWLKTNGNKTESVSPIDGKVIASVSNATIEDYETVISTAEAAFQQWKTVPAPHVPAFFLS